MSEAMARARVLWGGFSCRWGLWLRTEERYMNVNAFLRIDALTIHIKEGTAGSTFELEADEDQRILNSTL